MANINGHVWHDSNGLTDLQINEPAGASSPPSTLNIYLVDKGSYETINITNLITAKTKAGSNREYSFIGIEANRIYDVILSTINAAIGNTVPTPSLPPKWLRIGENLGAGPLSGSDNMPDGKLRVNSYGGDVYNANFGVRLNPAINVTKGSFFF